VVRVEPLTTAGPSRADVQYADAASMF
jgi:hypothetical protein